MRFVERTRYLIVGAGVSGLSFADWLGDEDYRVLEAEDEIGGYCRTVRKQGFVWDYAGHFFHFRDPAIEQDLVARMGMERVLRVRRDSRIWYAERLVDFPFQRNIHQLEEAEYQQCLSDWKARPEEPVSSFRDMLYARYGKAIAEKFLVPYNEKLYATDISTLDVHAMGRFFPHARVEEVLGGQTDGSAEDYNRTFTYPEGGAIQYIRALASGVRSSLLTTGEPVLQVDLERRVARTSHREIGFEHLISTVPFPSLLRICGLAVPSGVYSANKVFVLNLGFDGKGLTGVHWVYYPQPEISFYRVGFYDNIFGSERMSLYVELGLAADAKVEPGELPALRSRVMADLREVGLVTHQRLVASHEVLLDPAYVHISKRSIDGVQRSKRLLESCGVHSIGRYGSWTYCSIEDCIVEARALAERLRA